MIKCKEIATVYLSDQVQAQTLWRRLQIRFHLAMCDACTKFVAQLEKMRSAALSLEKENDADKDYEERVINRLLGR